jgi:purine-binding chemotaxis protein CheW
MIIPVVDLRRRFSLTLPSPNQRTVRTLIIRGAVPGARAGRDLLGLVVDSVREVLHIPAAAIETAPEAATGSSADFIAGVAKAADRLIILLDIKKLLSHTERAALAEVDDVHP